MEYSMETIRVVWSHRYGDRIEIGSDCDGLDIMEVRYITENGKPGAKLSFLPKQARLVANAMLACADEIDNQEKNAELY